MTDHLDRLSGTEDALEALERHVDFEVFRPVLVEALGYGERPRGGRPPYDPVVMFKVLVLASMHNLSDERMELEARVSVLATCSVKLRSAVRPGSAPNAFRM